MIELSHHRFRRSMTFLHISFGRHRHWQKRWPTDSKPRLGKRSFSGTGGEAREPHQVSAGGRLQLDSSEEKPDPASMLQECLKEQSKLSVCVMGPPGVNRSKYCQQLAAALASVFSCCPRRRALLMSWSVGAHPGPEDFKVKHIHVGKLLRCD